MRDEDLKVIEITLTCRDLLERTRVGWGEAEGQGLTVITPRPREELLNIWVSALLLANHCIGGIVMVLMGMMKEVDVAQRAGVEMLAI